MKKIIINANTDLGVMVDGANLGPRLITNDIKDIEVINIDKKDIKKSHDPLDLEKNLKEVNDVNERLYNEILKHDEFVITLGGDHAIGISSSLASLKKHKDLGIIWIDAHPDYNTFETTITGNLHGLPLACANGLCGKTLSYFHDYKYYNPLETTVVGARSIDEGEMDNLNDNKVLVIKTNELKNNIIKSMDEAFNRCNNKKIHISFDLDLIDPLVAPGVSVPEKNGITLEDAKEIFNYLIEHKNRIASIDIVEYNPAFDKNDITLNIAKYLLNEILENF